MQSKQSILSSEILARLIDSMADGFSVLDEAGRHLVVNQAMCRLTGWTRDELVGVGPPHPYWPPEHHDSIFAAFERTQKGDFGPFELTFLRKNGSRFPVLVSPSEVDGDDGKLVFATVKDVSALRYSERQLAETQGFLEAMLRGGDLASWDWHLTEGWAKVSDSYFTMLGYEPNEWVASYEEWAKRVHPDDIGAADNSMQMLLSDKGRLYDAEFRMLDAQGEWRWMLARGYVTERAADGEPCRITGTSQDIHRLKTQEEQLRQFQKMDVLGQLTGGIAHDLNNILAIIYGNLEIMKLNAPELEGVELAAVSDSLNRARDLTRALLRYSRNEAPRVELIDVNQRIRAVCEQFGSAGRLVGKLELELSDQPCTVRVDPGAFENALLNLLVNARDATHESGGEVRVTTKIESPTPLAILPSSLRVSICVADDGCGMPEEVAERALDPLFTTKPAGRGTGLGLAMVNKFVTGAEGAVTIDSTVGQGTRVGMVLPYVEGAPEAIGSAEESLSAQLHGTESIMIVDDESDLLSAIEKQLTFLGYDVRKSQNPRRALFELQREAVDLLLTDLVMPYTISGLELAQRARTIRPGIGLVFMTGYVDEPSRDEALKLGPVLAKPFTLAQLGGVLRRLLDQKT